MNNFVKIFPELSLNKCGVWKGDYARLENASKGDSPVKLFSQFPHFCVTLEETVLEYIMRTVLRRSKKTLLSMGEPIKEWHW